MSSYPVVMFEFIAADQEKLCEFYSSVFGWKYATDGGFAFVEDISDPPRVAIGGIGSERPGVPGYAPGAYFYLATNDLKKTLTAVERAGGSVEMPPTQAGEYWFAMFRDPEKNLVGLLLVND